MIVAYSRRLLPATKTCVPARAARCRAQQGQSSSFTDNSLPSRASKALVAGLTSVINLVVPPDRAQDRAFQNVRNQPAPAISPADVYKGVEEDFTTNCYLWTGNISEHIYDADCKFTDPTISFKGLATFKRNLASLRPVVDKLLRETGMQLLSCELSEEECAVTATWRMTGTFVFPWRPRLNVQGRTVFTYDPERGNRIVQYSESWNMPAAQALLQLLKPGPRSQGP